MPDDFLEHRSAWRHVVQCALAEQAARDELTRARRWLILRARVTRAEKRLLAEGIRLDAAIDALDDTLTEKSA